jgi:pimeloyl-ACP methyl ester carboxylesterase
MTVLDSLKISKVHVIGWSDGAITGLLLAIDHPDRIAALLTYGANFDHSGDVTTKPDSQIVALNKRYEALRAAQYHRLSPTPNNFRAFEATLGQLYVHEPTIRPAALRSIGVPTTVVAGDHDEFVLRSHTERLAVLIPGARLVILSDVSHEGPLQDPDGFHRVVERFLNDHA